MASKKKAKKTKRVVKPEVPKIELTEITKVILLGSKFNRAQDLEDALNSGWTIKSEVESRAGKYVVLSQIVEVAPVDFCLDCNEVHTN